MNFNIIHFLCLLGLTFVMNVTIAQETQPAVLNVQQQKLKDFAMCVCISKAFPLADSLLINDGSSAGYFNTSDYGINIFKDLDSMATAYYIHTKLGSKYNRTLGLHKCLDFYNGADLYKYIIGLPKPN